MNMSLASLCVPGTFGSVALFGTEVSSLEANVVNYNTTLQTFTFTEPTVHIEASFCNVTIGYTHPGQDDLIYVETWLPSPNAWNDRLLGVGGGGLAAGRSADSERNMALVLPEGFASVTTDAGVRDVFGTWGQLSPGNLNLVNIHNFAARSLEEQALIGKALVKGFYGRAEAYSYFSGCSQGGRQALMLAQRYPTLYDGVFANAPGISLSSVLISIYAPQQAMVDLGQAPHECEINAITAAAIAACDGLDGLADGIVAEPVACLQQFDPFSVVGATVNCSDAPGGQIAVSAAAATVVNTTWHGPTTVDGALIWPGFSPGADLTGKRPETGTGFGIANTNCSSGTCVGVPFPLLPVFIRAFLARDMSFDYANLTHKEWDRLVDYGFRELRSWDSDDTNLAAFQKAGGKMISYHGQFDQVVSLGGTTRYYQQVTSASPGVHSFYRLFEVPGLAHCVGGVGGYPAALFGQLRAWVENGTAPNSSPYEAKNQAGEVQNRLLCPSPQKPAFSTTCGNPALEECWSCAGTLPPKCR